MANLTVVVDATVLRRARQRAIEDGTSVSTEVRAFLLRYAREGTGFEGFLAISEQLDASSHFEPDAVDPDAPAAPATPAAERDR